MVLRTKGNGALTKQMVKESFGMLMAMYMRGNGRKIKRMAMAFTFT
jgi:hypothetical protein